MNNLLRALGVTAIDLPKIEVTDLIPEAWVLAVSSEVIQAGVIDEIIETGDGYTFVRVVTGTDALLTPSEARTHSTTTTTDFYAIDPVVSRRRFSIETIFSILRGNGFEYETSAPKITDLLDTNFEAVPVTLDMKDAHIAVFDHDSFVRFATIYATKTTTNAQGSRTEYNLRLYDDFIDGSANPVVVIPTDADA